MMLLLRQNIEREKSCKYDNRYDRLQQKGIQSYAVMQTETGTSKPGYQSDGADKVQSASGSFDEAEYYHMCGGMVA